MTRPVIKVEIPPELIQELKTEGLSPEEIEAHRLEFETFHLSETTRNPARQPVIETEPGPKRKRVQEPPVSKEELKKLYETHTLKEIGNMLGVSAYKVWTWTDYYGLRKRKKVRPVRKRIW